MTYRLIRLAIFSVTAMYALGSAVEAWAGDCHGGVYHSYGAHAYSCGPQLGAPAIHCSPYEAYLLFKKYPVLAKNHPELAAQLEARFAPSPAIVAKPAARAAVAVEESITSAKPAAPSGIVESSSTLGAASVVPGPRNEAIPVPSSTPGPEAVPAPAPTSTPSATPPVTPPNDAELLDNGPGPDLPPGGAPPAATPVAAAPPVRPELEPLLGLWQTVSIDPNGEQKVTQVNLASDGTATVTVDSTLGKVSLKRKFAIDDETKEFRLSGEGAPIVLGKVVTADKDQVVLEREGVNTTFTRPTP